MGENLKRIESAFVAPHCLKIAGVVTAPSRHAPFVTDEVQLVIDQSVGDACDGRSDGGAIFIPRKQLVSHPVCEEMAHKLIGTGVALPFPFAVLGPVPFSAGVAIVAFMHERSRGVTLDSCHGYETQHRGERCSRIVKS